MCDRPRPKGRGLYSCSLYRSFRAINDHYFLAKDLRSLLQQTLSRLRHKSVLTKNFDTHFQMGFSITRLSLLCMSNYDLLIDDRFLEFYTIGTLPRVS